MTNLRRFEMGLIEGDERNAPCLLLNYPPFRSDSEMGSTPEPESVAFYASGRASLETPHMYQLLARLLAIGIAAKGCVATF